MNEHELKSALQDAMVASSPPPPMDAGAALERGRRAHRRRQATWGGAVAGLGVVAIAVGAVLVPNLAGGDGLAGVGAQSSESRSADARPSMTSIPPSPPQPETSNAASASPSRGEEGVPWPNGQGDRTSTNGPRADKSVAVLNDLASSLPNGVGVEDRERLQHRDYGPMTRTQSQFADYAADGLEVWEYLAYTPVVRSGAPGVGQLWVQVETKGNKRLQGPGGCGMVVEQVYPASQGGRCDEVDAAGARVAVVTAEGTAEGMEQAAFYKHADGTLVIVAQSREYERSGHPGLAELPLTPQQLAAIAADPKFRLD
ncbi:hypothetical protein ACRAKI_28285 [Saccharothrix isguenensis]